MVEQMKVDTSQAAAPKASSAFDLDWELQRLLGDEVRAMEPAEEKKTSTKPTAQTPRPDQLGAVPASATTTKPSQVPVSTSPKTAGTTAATTVSAPPAATPKLDDSLQTLAQSISREIDALYQQMTREVGAQAQGFDEVAALLQQARIALTQGTEGITEAEKLTKQAQGLLRRKEESRRWAASYGSLILGYEFLFFIAFVCVLAFDRPLAAWAGTWTHVTDAVHMRDILPFWDTMVWGGIGGVVGALYSLYWHVAELQDFDRQYNMWYVVQPVMGAMLGAFIYLIVISGMLAMNTNIQITSSSWFPSALACLCGFRQKFIFELLDKLMEVIGLRPILSKVGQKDE